MFQEVDRGNGGKITPGMLLCVMTERGLEVDKIFAVTFLRMDLNGNGMISLDEWRQGYQVRRRPARPARAGTPPADRTASSPTRVPRGSASSRMPGSDCGRWGSRTRGPTLQSRLVLLVPHSAVRP